MGVAKFFADLGMSTISLPSLQSDRQLACCLYLSAALDPEEAVDRELQHAPLRDSHLLADPEDHLLVRSNPFIPIGFGTASPSRSSSSQHS